MKVALEVDSRSEPIVGSMAEEDGATYPFVGWLGFASVLRRVLRHEAECPPTPEREEEKG
jgi:hypothetical protein